ncbi:hypothetical protein LCGC14_1912630, partial [marine sediment metagenome]
MTRRKSISSLEGFLANQFRQRVGERFEMIRAGSGLSLLAPSLYYDQDTSSWKTSQASEQRGWDSSSLAWPRSGMMRNGTAYRLPPSGLHTSESECSLWRTPTVGALNADRAKDPEYGLRKAAKGQTITLADQVRWPTPQAHDAAKGKAERVGRYGTEHGGRN